MEKQNEVLCKAATKYQKIFGGDFGSALIACEKMTEGEIQTFAISEDEGWPEHIREISLICSKHHSVSPKEGLRKLCDDIAKIGIIRMV